MPRLLTGCGVLCGLLGALSARAQDPPGTIRFRLPPVTVTAQKAPEDIQESPVSVTAVTEETLESAGVRSVADAAQYAPNTFFTEFTARKLSNARFRGVGASPDNPAVTTYIDGVPQLHANSSSIELVGIDQIEFVRGPQSALFGRNALGGLINITSSRPSLTKWTGSVAGPYGNFKAGDIRGAAAGPLVADRLGFGIGIGYAGRDGFTRNESTGHDLDSRSAAFGKAQLLWTPTADWEVRGILSGERARDGDYGLNDLAALGAKPHRASRDFEGFTHRTIVSSTLLMSRRGKAVDVSSTTGFLSWTTDDLTDLDYTVLPMLRRDNHENADQITQEFRVASARSSAVKVSDRVTLKWQAGVSFFSQDYTQDAVNTFSPFVLSRFVPFPLAQHSPQSTLESGGAGVYGEATFTFNRNLDASIGLRADHENKTANLRTFFSPAIAPPAVVDAERDFTDVSPQLVLAYRAAPRRTVYVTAAKGFKAGGFNAASPPGSEAYGGEYSWNYEGGVKTSWLGDRLSANGAVFFLSWRDLQVNVPNPFVPAQFYIANAGRATSKGFEIELSARPLEGFDLFGALGYTRARFGSGSISGGANVSGRKLSNTPDYTANLGTQYSRPVSGAATLYGRAEIVSYGAYRFDDANTAGQSAYALANFRGGVRGNNVWAEAWTRNAFDTRFITTAFAYPGLAPSGFVGEMGPARTFGVRAGVNF